MEIKAEAMKRCELVSVSGRVDSSTAPELEKVLLGLIQSGQKNIVVNLKGGGGGYGLYQQRWIEGTAVGPYEGSQDDPVWRRRNR